MAFEKPNWARVLEGANETMRANLPKDSKDADYLRNTINDLIADIYTCDARGMVYNLMHFQRLLTENTDELDFREKASAHEAARSLELALYSAVGTGFPQTCSCTFQKDKMEEFLQAGMRDQDLPDQIMCRVFGTNCGEDQS